LRRTDCPTLFRSLAPIVYLLIACAPCFTAFTMFW